MENWTLTEAYVELKCRNNLENVFSTHLWYGLSVVAFNCAAPECCNPVSPEQETRGGSSGYHRYTWWCKSPSCQVTWMFVSCQVCQGCVNKEYSEGCRAHSYFWSQLNAVRKADQTFDTELTGISVSAEGNKTDRLKGIGCLCGILSPAAACSTKSPSFSRFILTGAA